MRIYIDEAGPFMPPVHSRSSFSLVLAHVVPVSVETELFYEFLRLRDTWPNQAVEIKGSKLNERQAAQVINLVSKYDTIVQFAALDTNTHRDALVQNFKNRQADAVTANITRENHPGPIPHLHQLGEAVRAMSNQLFLQTFAMWELIIRTIREGTLYYVQRQPEELGNIGWVIDRKDRTRTEMEETWTTLLLPLSERSFGKEPLICIADGDYSHFDARYGITESTADDETLQHMAWLDSVYPVPRGVKDTVKTDIKKLLTEQQQFEDSYHCLGLQLTDMLASILRRALNDHLQIDGWRDFGALLVAPIKGFIQYGTDKTPLLGQAEEVWQVLNEKAKPMFAAR
jgi:hypothetical protein